jgi:predicted O-linked N-acetylglucosamine transferase (SPINDLY family)
LGNAQGQLGRLAEAEAAQRRAIALRPDLVVARINLGNLLAAGRRWDEAHAVRAQAVALDPTNAHGWTNLGFALRGLDRLEEARAAFERAIALEPALPPALIALGDTCQGLRDYPQAVAAYARASTLAPDNAGLWKHYAVALERVGLLERAADAYERSLALDPSQHDVGINLIYLLDALPVSLEAANGARRAWNDRHARPLAHLIRPHTNNADPERRLRIGFVSADLRRHSAASCMLAILEHHDPAAVEIVCYSNSPIQDDYTERFKAVAARWRQVEALSDEALAAEVRADEIDILVDLSGYSSHTRLPMFARKPAPIQVTAWGYATGTGLDAMDAYFSDPVLVPPHEEHLYAERIVHLPSVLCYAPPPAPPPVVPPPALARGTVTFGSYSRALKITPDVLETWARVLHAVPGSRLLLKPGLASAADARERILGPLAARGIAGERVEILPQGGHAEHLASFGQLDLQLDPFPQSGGITTLDGLLMGVPCVTLLGERPIGRSSASFLTSLGLEDLVARTTDEYVTIAVRLAGNVERLARERATLRDRLLDAPLGNGRTYTRAVEQAYRTLWREWCAKTGEEAR